MDVPTLAIVSGICALIFAVSVIFVVVKMLKKKDMIYLVPAIILTISECGSLILFFICLFKLLNLV